MQFSWFDFYRIGIANWVASLSLLPVWLVCISFLHSYEVWCYLIMTLGYGLALFYALKIIKKYHNQFVGTNLAYILIGIFCYLSVLSTFDFLFFTD